MYLQRHLIHPMYSQSMPLQPQMLQYMPKSSTNTANVTNSINPIYINRLNTFPSSWYAKLAKHCLMRSAKYCSSVNISFITSRTKIYQSYFIKEIINPLLTFDPAKVISIKSERFVLMLKTFRDIYLINESLYF